MSKSEDKPRHLEPWEDSGVPWRRKSTQKLGILPRVVLDKPAVPAAFIRLNSDITIIKGRASFLAPRIQKTDPLRAN